MKHENKERVRSIVNDALEKIFEVLEEDKDSNTSLGLTDDMIGVNIHNVNFKEYLNSVEIDKNKLSMLEMIPRSELDVIFQECKDWIDSGYHPDAIKNDSLFSRFIISFQQMSGKSFDAEASDCAELLHYKWNELNGLINKGTINT